MKKILAALIALTIMLSVCACTPNVSDVSDTEQPQESSEAAKPLITTLSTKTVLQSDKAVKITNDASKLTDEEAIELASSFYLPLVDIAGEFYGFPRSLFYESPGGIPADEQYHAKIVSGGKSKGLSGIIFEIDVEQINSVLETYLTKDLIALAFNLQQPCPIYVQGGELYRTTYEPNTSNVAIDINAGKIISRENGIVRFVYPVYYVNYDTNVPIVYDEIIEDYVVNFNYIDFVYENGRWKANDFRLIGSVYAGTPFPAGRASIAAEDYFEAKLETNKEGVAVVLNNSLNAEITVNGKTVSATLENRSGKIKEIKESGDNIFVTFTGVVGKDETIVISKTTGEKVSQFASHGFVANGNDWYYLKLDYENNLCDLLDKDGKAIHGFGVPHYRKGEVGGYSLHTIAPIDNVTFDNSEFKVTFEEMFEEAEEE